MTSSWRQRGGQVIERLTVRKRDRQALSALVVFLNTLGKPLFQAGNGVRSGGLGDFLLRDQFAEEAERRRAIRRPPPPRGRARLDTAWVDRWLPPSCWRRNRPPGFGGQSLRDGRNSRPMRRARPPVKWWERGRLSHRGTVPLHSRGRCLELERGGQQRMHARHGRRAEANAIISGGFRRFSL